VRLHLPRACWGQAGLVLVLVGLVLLFGAGQPRFLSPTTLALIFKYYSPVAILALGMTFVILTGGIDLSVGFVMMLLMFVMAGLPDRGLVPPGLAVLIGLGLGLALGGLVGIGVSVAGIPPFILTLALMVGSYGATLLLSGNQAIPRLPPELTSLGAAEFRLGAADFPTTLPLVVALYLASALVLRRTPFGRALYALGSNREAARLNGIPVARIETSAYMILGACCWLAGWIQLGVNRTADPKVALSDNLELNAIAMVVIGGTSLTGGRGGVGGTALGACLLAVLFNGLPMLGGQFGDTSWRKLVQAGVILAGAFLDALQRRWGGEAVSGARGAC